MKIIGKTEGGFIIQASETEMVRLIGYYSTSAAGCPQLRIGQEINVSTLYEHLYRQASFDARNKEVIKLLDEVKAMYVLPNPLEPSK